MNRAFFILGAAVAAIVASGCVQDRPATLASLERFRLDRFPVACWAWGGPFDDRYCTEFRRVGFNTIIGHPEDKTLRMAEKHGYRLMLGTGRDPKRVMEVHGKYGHHPEVMGYHLDDNCDLHNSTVQCAQWLLKTDPAKVPWISSNPNPVAQSKVPMPVITTQIYPFSESAGLPEPAKRRVFCNQCERDRSLGNRYDLVAMPFIGTYAHQETPSQYRFQANAAVAYGSKGFWVFAYNRYFRAVLNRAAGPANRYIADVAGPPLLSRRSVGVFHTGPEFPGDCERPGAGKLIEAMDPQLLAGVFVPEAAYRKGLDAPDYVMVVDKRTVAFSGRAKLPTWTMRHGDREPRPPWVRDLIEQVYREDPAPRRARVTFSDRVRAVEALLPDGAVERLDARPGKPVTLPGLRGGAAVLLRIRARARPMDPASARPVVRRLPSSWKFQMDRDNVAEKERWAAPDFDDAAWKELLVDKNCGWRDQGYGNHVGSGWYRLRVTVPEAATRKHLYLHFGAADEEAWVYVDGKLAFAHTRQATGVGLVEIWTRPFAFDCAQLLADGKEHTLAVHVHNFYGAGGLYRPVHLVASDRPLDRDALWRAIEAGEEK